MSRSAAQIRREFIEFFAARGHAHVPGSSVIPYDDPTLLFTNAGMNQFKPLFLGTADRATEFGRLRRAANSQPCIRAGGKHNDLDDVGHDTYHHTFFEMLGNWSFGDYFKRDAIAWAWELITKVWGLEPSRLHATYFGGDPAEGLEPDLEARELWMQIAGLPAGQVHPGNKKDNFWEMGDTGPCGPCSEIHIDLTPDKSGAALVNAGDERVIEFWNLVFIQFNRGADGALTPLPAKHVDTGMGFERIARIVQGRRSNYDVDVFTPIFDAIQRVSGAPAYAGRMESDPDAATHQAGVMRDVAYRVIADHARTLTFAISDGCVPDKDGRGFVLRRILRRAVRYGWQYLGLKRPFLCELAPTVVDVMSEAFPSLAGGVARVVDALREEEESFGRTLDRGIALFNDAAEQAAHDHHREIRGEDAFKLHDTFGFPIDLTQIMAQERGLSVDIGEYERRMDEARQRARAGGASGHGAPTLHKPELVTPFGPTDDSPKYAEDRCRGRVRAIVQLDSGGETLLSESGQAITIGAEAAVVFDRTCFYAEQGGQVGDVGQLTGPGLRFDVAAVQRFGSTVALFGTLVQGRIAVGDEIEQRVDARREATRRNHTATHILNWALRDVLGDHVQQRGSLVDPDRTRFDFANPAPLATDQLARVEELCAAQITQNLTVHAREAPQADALRIHGLRAVFGEKYPDTVRVVSIGVPVDDLLANPTRADWRKFSIEFCGGTHVAATGEIERFALVAEEGVAKGIRRVVGVTGLSAQLAIEFGAALRERTQQLLAAARAGNAPDSLADDLSGVQEELNSATLRVVDRQAIRALLEELQAMLKKQQRAAASTSARDALAHADSLLAQAVRRGDSSLIVAEVPEAPLDSLKTLCDALKQKARSAAILLATRGEKATLLAAVTDDLIQRGVKAGDWIKAVAPLVDGGGGGPPTMAQAGGKNPEKLPAALEAARAWVEAKLPE